MNRIELLTQEIPKPAITSQPKQKEFRQSERSTAAPSALFVPLHYEKNYAYPLIVWLHGPGDDERQLQKVMPLISMRNHAAVAPQGTDRDPLVAGAHIWEQNPRSIELACRRALACVEQAQERLNIAGNRIFLGGYQGGGSMALRVALQFPERFAGAFSLGGAFPRDHAPLSRIAAVRRLPLFITYGEDSVDYPLNQVSADLRLFHLANLKVDLRQYHAADELTTNMLSDLDAWVMQHVLGEKIAR